MSLIPMGVPRHALEEDRVSVGVLVLPGRCWRCNQVTYPIVGVLVAGDAGPVFLEFSEVADRLAATLSKAQLRAFGTGPITHRWSRARCSSSLSNGCLHCDAIQGDFPLREDLAAFTTEGGLLTELLVGQVLLTRASRRRGISQATVEARGDVRSTL